MLVFLFPNSFFSLCDSHKIDIKIVSPIHIIYKKYVFGLRNENNDRDPLWCTLCTNGNRIFESWNCFTCGRRHLLAAMGSTLIICKQTEISIHLFETNLERQNWPELNGLGLDDVHPYPDSIVSLHRQPSNHDIHGTYCVFPIVNRIATKCRSSLFWRVLFRRPVSTKQFRRWFSWIFSIDARNTKIGILRQCCPVRKFSSYREEFVAPSLLAIYGQ